MDKKIGDIFHKQAKGLFGIEIEVEGKGLPEEDELGKLTDDLFIDRGEGSLRDGGLEYVFREPKGMEESLALIGKLANKFQEVKCVPKFTPRTSVHVHVNITDLTVEQTCVMIVLSHMAEPFISSMCGVLREGNHFCLRAIDAEGIMKKVHRSIMERVLPRYGAENRYGFTNIASIRELGSLEYRGMEGTFHLKRLEDWLTVLNNIKEAAIQIDTLDNLFQLLEEEDAVDLLRKFKIYPKLKYIMTIQDMEERKERVEEMLLYYRTAHVSRKKTKGLKAGEHIFEGNPFRIALHLGA